MSSLLSCYLLSHQHLSCFLPSQLLLLAKVSISMTTRNVQLPRAWKTGNWDKVTQSDWCCGQDELHRCFKAATFLQRYSLCVSISETETQSVIHTHEKFSKWNPGKFWSNGHPERVGDLTNFKIQLDYFALLDWIRVILRQLYSLKSHQAKN